MDLMTLAAKIVLDDSSYTKGVSNAEKMGKGLSQKMSAMTVAVGNIAADMIRKGVSSINKVIGGAIDGYGNYQQLIGGVETLFKSSSDTVARYARQSFKTTGLSANDYMETVTGFSAALIQGLGGDTARAAELANTAVTDMSDNANKMGTDIGAIQTAYQGFAKQNYTMLDNLKLGYGGTQKEMVRLINDSKILDHEIENLDGITFDQIIEAIHKVQTEMGITGTTSKEAAETLEGSKNAMKAAWQDMLSAIGGEGDQTRLDQAMENFKTSFSTYMENFIPTLVTSINNSGSLVTAIADSIGNLPTDLLSQIADGGLNAGTEIVGGISKITSWIIDSISSMFRKATADPSQIAEFGAAVGEFLGTAISDIVANAPDIAAGIVTVGVTLAGSLIEGLFKGLFGEGNEVDKLTDKMNDNIADANTDALKSSAILDYMTSLQEKYGSAVTNTTAWKDAVDQLSQVLPGAGEVIQRYGSDIQGAIDKLKEMSKQLRVTAVMNAMNEAMQGQYKLLGEQTLAREQSISRQTIAQQTIDNAVPQLAENLKIYANEMMRLNQDMGPEMLEQYQQLAQGIGQDGKPLLEQDFSTLSSLMTSVAGALERAYDMYGEEGETKIWDKSELDDIFNPEYLLGDLPAALKTAAQTIQQETQNQADLTAQIEATEREISTTEMTIQRTAQDIAYGAQSAADGIDSGGTQVAGALGSVASQIGSIKIPRIMGGFSYTPEATGIDNVPYNGFRAELHRGEMVLTKRRAENIRNGAGTAEVVGAIQEMRQDLQNMKLVVGRKTFGRAVVDYGARSTREYIGQSENRQYAGYGT